MEFIDDIKKKLSEEEFSLELLNYCKNHFQYGGFDEEDEAKFKMLFSENIRKSLPYLTQQQINQIAQVCIDRGIFDTKDILFLDGAAFAVKFDDSDSVYGIQEKVDFIWVSKEYRWCDFLDFTFFFTNEELTRKDKLFLERLRDELNEIFIKYYNIATFPKELGLNSATGQEVAIKCDVEQIINGLNNNTSFPISIICNINGTNEILLTKLTYNPYGERLIVIDEMNKNVIKLSEMLNKKNKVKVSNSSISTSEEVMNSFMGKLNSGEIKKDISVQTGKVFTGIDEEIKSELESYQSLLESGIIKQESKDEQGPILKKIRK